MLQPPAESPPPPQPAPNPLANVLSTVNQIINPGRGNNALDNVMQTVNQVVNQVTSLITAPHLKKVRRFIVVVVDSGKIVWLADFYQSDSIPSYSYWRYGNGMRNFRREELGFAASPRS